MLTKDQELEIEFYLNVFSEMTYKGIIYYNDFPDESMHVLFILDYYKPFGDFAPVFEQFKEVMMDGFEMFQQQPERKEFWNKYLKYKEDNLTQLKNNNTIPALDNVAIRPYMTEYIKKEMIDALNRFKASKNYSPAV
jgi:hypothetical protein